MMGKYKFFYLMVLLSFYGCNVPFQTFQKLNQLTFFKPKIQTIKDPERIAVLNLNNEAKIKQGELNYLSEIIREAASRLPSEKYHVMTKDNISTMLPPDTKLEDCQDSCAITTGRNIGAHWVLVGSVFRYGRSLRITIALHRTANGVLKKSKTVKGKTMEDLEQALEEKSIALLSILDSTLSQAVQEQKHTKEQQVRNSMIEREIALLEHERLENERLGREQLEHERLERLERIQRARLEHEERIEQARLERERLERERLERERLDRERLERERLDRERLERERLDRERLERERFTYQERTSQYNQYRPNRLPSHLNEVFEVFDTYKDPNGEYYLALKRKPYPKGRARNNWLIAQLPDGTQLIVLQRGVGYRKAWLKVKVISGPHQGIKGYVHSNWVRQIY